MSPPPRNNFLRSPTLYIGLQRMLGADKLRRTCLDDVLKLREGERVLDIGILDHMPRVDYVGFPFFAEACYELRAVSTPSAKRDRCSEPRRAKIMPIPTRLPRLAMDRPASSPKTGAGRA